MSEKYTDDRISCRNSFGRITKRGSRDGQWLDGDVLTPNGIVSVYSQQDHTRLDFCYGGRLHMRSYKKSHTARGMVMLAGRFAKEITTPKPE